MRRGSGPFQNPSSGSHHLTNNGGCQLWCILIKKSGRIFCVFICIKNVYCVRAIANWTLGGKMFYLWFRGIGVPSNFILEIIRDPIEWAISHAEQKVLKWMLMKVEPLLVLICSRFIMAIEESAWEVSFLEFSTVWAEPHMKWKCLLEQIHIFNHSIWGTWVTSICQRALALRPWALPPIFCFAGVVISEVHGL